MKIITILLTLPFVITLDVNCFTTGQILLNVLVEIVLNLIIAVVKKHLDLLPSSLSPEVIFKFKVHSSRLFPHNLRGSSKYRY